MSMSEVKPNKRSKKPTRSAAFLPSDARATLSKDRQQILGWRNQISELKARVQLGARGKFGRDNHINPGNLWRANGAQRKAGEHNRGLAAMLGRDVSNNWNKTLSLPHLNSLHFSNIRAKIQMVATYSVAPGNAAALIGCSDGASNTCVTELENKLNARRPSQGAVIEAMRKCHLPKIKPIACKFPTHITFGCPEPLIPIVETSRVANENLLGRKSTRGVSIDDGNRDNPNAGEANLFLKDNGDSDSESLSVRAGKVRDCTKRARKDTHLMKVWNLERSNLPQCEESNRPSYSVTALPQCLLDVCDETLPVDERYDRYLRDLEKGQGNTSRDTRGAKRSTSSSSANGTAQNVCEGDTLVQDYGRFTGASRSGGGSWSLSSPPSKIAPWDTPELCCSGARLALPPISKHCH